MTIALCVHLSHVILSSTNQNHSWEKKGFAGDISTKKQAVVIVGIAD
jgi:hypothetical protein